MIEDTMLLQPSREEEVRACVARLLSGDISTRLAAAAGLGDLGVRNRLSTRPRGNWARAAESALPEPEQGLLPRLVECLKDDEEEFRCQMSLALGEWGDESAARALDGLVRNDQRPQVRFYGITGLQTIGGPTAVKALRWLADHADEPVRGAAHYALDELYTGGSADDTEGRPIPAEGPVALRSNPNDWIHDIRHLETLSDRERANKWVALVKQRISEQPDVGWPNRLIHTADACRWPKWSVQALPTPLIVRVDEKTIPTPEPLQTWLIWEHVLVLVGGASIASLCGGVVRRASLSPEQVRLLGHARIVDLARQHNPFWGLPRAEMNAVFTAELEYGVTLQKEAEASKPAFAAAVGRAEEGAKATRKKLQLVFAG